MKKMLQFYKYLMSFLLVTLPFLSMAQGMGGNVEMADTMRSNGKIYVVVMVLATILLMLFIFLFIIDRKITKLEKKNQK